MTAPRRVGYWAVAAIGIAGLLGNANAASAQQKKEKLKLKLTGTFEGFAGAGIIKVKSKQDEPWLVKIEAGVDEIHITGSAAVDFLKPGMWIYVTGKFDERGKAKEKIQSLTVTARRSATRPGVVRELPTGEEAPVDGNKPAVPDDYFIVGRLAKVKGRDLTVQTGGKPVKIELAEDVVIGVNLADFRIVQPGDAIELSGYYFEKGRAVANAGINVTLSQPLTGEKPKKKKQ
jgi:hypothetical protein